MRKGHFRTCERLRNAADCGCEKRRYALALAILGFAVPAETVFGVWSGSLALLSDAGHAFMDSLALAVAYMVARSARGRAAKSGGIRRIGGCANAALLAVISAMVFAEALHRLLTPPAVQSAVMLAGAVIGLLGNIGQWFVLRSVEPGERNVTHRSAYLHVLSDLWQSITVIAGAVVIAACGWTLVDPLLSLALAGALAYWSYDIFRMSWVAENKKCGS